MKIGTITVHNGNNYGASLQAYSLIQFLRGNGFNAYLIDYRNTVIEKRLSEKTTIANHQLSLSTVKDNIRKFVSNMLFETAKYTSIKEKIFEDFHRDLFERGLGPFFDVEGLGALNSSYDAFICGSDQIWNQSITGLDDAFFLSFASEEKERIAYAPSIGGPSDRFTDSEIDEYREKIKHIHYLSVREENNKDFVENISGKNCIVAVDPVILLEEQNWNSAIENIDPLVDTEYAVYYPVVAHPELEKMAFMIAKEKRIQLVNPRLVPRYAKAKGYSAVSNRMVGPLEFVRLIKDATCVFTNSFHATVFSSLFDKELYVLKLKGSHAKRNNRIVEYLRMIDFYSESHNSGDVLHVVSFSREKLYANLKPKRSESIEYLLSALSAK